MRSCWSTQQDQPLDVNVMQLCRFTNQDPVGHQTPISHSHPPSPNQFSLLMELANQATETTNIQQTDNTLPHTPTQTGSSPPLFHNLVSPLMFSSPGMIFPEQHDGITRTLFNTSSPTMTPLNMISNAGQQHQGANDKDGAPTWQPVDISTALRLLESFPSPSRPSPFGYNFAASPPPPPLFFTQQQQQQQQEKGRNNQAQRKKKKKYTYTKKKKSKSTAAATKPRAPQEGATNNQYQDPLTTSSMLLQQAMNLWGREVEEAGGTPIRNPLSSLASPQEQAVGVGVQQRQRSTSVLPDRGLQNGAHVTNHNEAATTSSLADGLLEAIERHLSEQQQRQFCPNDINNNPSTTPPRDTHGTTGSRHHSKTVKLTGGKKKPSKSSAAAALKRKNSDKSSPPLKISAFDLLKVVKY